MYRSFISNLIFSHITLSLSHYTRLCLFAALADISSGGSTAVAAMDPKSLLSLVEQLGDNIDDLDENLQPLLEGALPTTTQKLPLLDRAKLNVLLVYSIESLLFCELLPA